MTWEAKKKKKSMLCDFFLKILLMHELMWKCKLDEKHGFLNALPSLQSAQSTWQHAAQAKRQDNHWLYHGERKHDAVYDNACYECMVARMNHES